MLILSVHAYHEGEPTIEKPQSYKTGSGKSALCTPTLVQADRQPTEVACTQTRLRVNNIALPLSFALNYVQPHELEETLDVYMFWFLNSMQCKPSVQSLWSIHFFSWTVFYQIFFFWQFKKPDFYSLSFSRKTMERLICRNVSTVKSIYYKVQTSPRVPYFYRGCPIHQRECKQTIQQWPKVSLLSSLSLVTLLVTHWTHCLYLVHQTLLSYIGVILRGKAPPDLLPLSSH